MNKPHVIINPFEIINARLSNIEDLLLYLKHKSGETPSQPETEYDQGVEQAAEILKIAPSTVYSLVGQGILPFSKKGKRLYFSKQELRDWIKSGRKKTVSEIEAEALNSVGLKRVRK